TLCKLAELYEDLGRAWTELAHAALPDDVASLREVKDLHARKAELTAAGGNTDEIQAVWARLSELERESRDRFPLSHADYDSLRAALQMRVLKIHKQEVAAHAALGKAIS